MAAWLTAWLSRGLAPTVLLVLAACTALLGGLQVRARPMLAAALICSSAAAVAVSARAGVREGDPVAALAQRQAAVVLEVVVTDDPRRAADPRRELVVAPVRGEQVTAAGTTTRIRVPVLILSSERAWLGLLPSQRVRVEGRLKPPERTDQVAAVLSARGPPVVLAQPSSLQRVAGHLRAGLRRAVDPLPAAERGLLPGLVVGDVSRLEPQLRDDFRLTGLSHLVAVSGTNVAIVVGAVLLLGRAVGLGAVSAPAISALALAGFVVLARPSPSVLRATVMGLVGLLALVAGSRRSALPALSGAVLLLVLIDPGLAAAPGFALSVLATAGLLVLAPPLATYLRRWLPTWAAVAIAVPAAAQAACGPVVVALASNLGLLSVPANLLAAPAVAPATILGVLAALIAPLSLPVAQGLAWLAYLPTAWLVRIAHTGADLPGAAVGWPGGTTGGLLLAGLTLVVLALLVRRRARRALAAAVVGALLAVVGLRAAGPSWPPADWVLAACDVGQGDALVLRTGGGAAVVVDAGPDPRSVDHCLRRLGIRTVPMLLLTHLHADHVDGIAGVLRRPVGMVQIGPLDQPPLQAAAVLRLIAAARVPLARAALDEQRSVAGVRWQVLAPSRVYRGTASDPNNVSLVLRVEVAGMVVLLTGDIEPPAQDDLLQRGLDLRADVLKVPHHGSRHQSAGFLRAVRPRVALTSVGAGNRYGHPAAGTLELLREAGARSFRTDDDGPIAVAGDGTALRVVAAAGTGTTSGPRADPAEPTASTALSPHTTGQPEIAGPADLVSMRSGRLSGSQVSPTSDVAARARSPPVPRGIMGRAVRDPAAADARRR